MLVGEAGANVFHDGGGVREGKRELSTNVAQRGNVGELWEIGADVGPDAPKHLQSVPCPGAGVFDGVLTLDLERRRDGDL